MDIQREMKSFHLKILFGSLKFFVVACVAFILFWMPLHINIELKHVFNTAKEYEFGRALMLAFIFWGLTAALRGSIHFPRTKVFYLFAATIFYMFISILWSVSPDLSLREFAPQLGCFLLFSIVLSTIHSERIIQWLISITIAASFLVTIYGLFQYYDLDDLYFPAYNFQEFMQISKDDLVKIKQEVKKPLWNRNPEIMRLVPNQMTQDMMERVIEILPEKRAVKIQTHFFGELEVQHGVSPISLIVEKIPFGVTFFRLFGTNPQEFFRKIHLPQKPEEHYKIYAFMGHRNYFSGYLVLIIPLVLIRLLYNMQRMGSCLQLSLPPLQMLRSILLIIFYSLHLVWMTNCVFFTQTRGAIMGMVVSLCFLLLCSFLLANLEKRRMVFIGVFSSVGLVSLLLGSMFVFTKLLPSAGELIPFLSKEFLFHAAIVVSGLCFLALLFLFRQIIALPFLLIVFCILLIGNAPLFFVEGGSELVRSNASMTQRIADTADWGGSAHQRSLIYSTTLRIITDDPFTLVFGKGVGTFGIHYMLYQVKLFLDTEVSGRFLWDTNKSIYAHNEYIHFWSELGMLGLGLFLAFWYFYVRRVLSGVLRLYRREYSSNPLRVLTVLALLSGTIGTLVHCVFTFDLHLIYSMVTFYCWMAFALILVGVRYDELPLPQISGLKYLLLLSSLGLSLYFAFGLNDYYYANTFYMIMVYGLATFFGLLFLSFFFTNLGKLCSLSLRFNLFFVVFGLSTAVFLHLEDIYQRDKYWRLAFAKFSVKDWREAFNLYQRALQHDSTLGELLFDFGRAMMDSNDDPRIPKSDIDRFSIKTIVRNLNLHTMYQRDTEGPNDELTDENLTNNFIAVSAFLEARYNFTDPANFHNIALCFYKEHQQHKNKAMELQQRAQQMRDHSLQQEAERLAKLAEVLGEKSKDYYRAAIDLNPIYAQSLSNLGYLSALEAQRKIAESSAMADKELGATKKNAALSEMETARSMLQRAFRLPDGKTPTTILGLATIHQSLGEMEDALKMYIELDRSSPGNPDAKIRIAEIYQHQFLQLNQAGNEISAEQVQLRREYLEEAEKYFFEAAELQSGEIADRLRHRALRLRIHRLSELFRDNAEDYKNYMELALAWVKLGILDLPDPEREENLSKGIGALRNLIQRNPNDVEARLFLARAYEEMGDIESVRESYERVLRLMNPSHSEYRSVLRRLQVLQLNNPLDDR